MEAKAVPGLCAIGEAVDVTGWLGGGRGGVVGCASLRPLPLVLANSKCRFEFAGYAFSGVQDGRLAGRECRHGQHPLPET